MPVHVRADYLSSREIRQRATSGPLETLVVSRGTESSRGHNRRKHTGRNPERDMSHCLLHLSALQPGTQQPPRPRHRACAARGKRRIVTAMIDRVDANPLRRRLQSHPWHSSSPEQPRGRGCNLWPIPHFGSKKRFHRSACQETEDRDPVIQYPSSDRQCLTTTSTSTAYLNDGRHVLCLLHEIADCVGQG
jgi:hypothetical protein